VTTTTAQLPTELQIFYVLKGEALDVWRSPTGEVGRMFRGAGIEAVWVSKQDEAIDPEWFSQRSVDLIVVIRGQLCVEFAEEGRDRVVLDPGDLLVLPPNTRCRGYRWPRECREATVFLAVYPVRCPADGSGDDSMRLDINSNAAN
jgi:hypothetical protein